VGILIIWILLGGAYAWSVWNLARMVRSQDSGASPVASLPSSQAQQIELVHPGKTPRRSALAAQLLQPRQVATLPRRSTWWTSLIDQHPAGRPSGHPRRAEGEAGGAPCAEL